MCLSVCPQPAWRAPPAPNMGSPTAAGRIGVLSGEGSRGFGGISGVPVPGFQCSQWGAGGVGGGSCAWGVLRVQ